MIISFVRNHDNDEDYLDPSRGGSGRGGGGGGGGGSGGGGGGSVSAPARPQKFHQTVLPEGKKFHDYAAVSTALGEVREMPSKRPMASGSTIFRCKYDDSLPSMEQILNFDTAPSLVAKVRTVFSSHFQSALRFSHTLLRVSGFAEAE